MRLSVTSIAALAALTACAAPPPLTPDQAAILVGHGASATDAVGVAGSRMYHYATTPGASIELTFNAAQHCTGIHQQTSPDTPIRQLLIDGSGGSLAPYHSPPNPPNDGLNQGDAPADTTRLYNELAVRCRSA